MPLCEPQTRSGLPDTGQTTCYGQDGKVIDCTSDICAGQDGFYTTGCPSEGRFVDNRDGTVTDTCTRLMWQKDTGNDGGRLSWCAALAYCENIELGGHDDWRRPNIRELQSIVDYGRYGPAIDPVFGALSLFYWSSTSHASVPLLAWSVLLHGGSVILEMEGLGSGVKSSANSVRAVRSGL